MAKGLKRYVINLFVGVPYRHVQNKRLRANEDEGQRLVRPLQSKTSKDVVVSSIHRMKTRASSLSKEVQRVQEAMSNMQAEKAYMVVFFEQWAAEKEKEILERSNQMVEQRVEMIKQGMLQQIEQQQAAERSQSQGPSLKEMAQEFQRMKDLMVKFPERITCLHLTSR
jgi:hypothetical protein